MNKNILRRNIRQIRDAYSFDEILYMSSLITNSFCDKYDYLNTFLLYYPLGNEVNTIGLIERLYSLNKQIYLPKVTGSTMEFRKFTGFSDLVKGRYDVLEPAGELLNAKADIVCVPGVVFDMKCNRIGYGGGFYDKFFSSIKHIIKSAFAFEFQIVEEIETESFDIPVDEIFTEKRIINRRI